MNVGDEIVVKAVEIDSQGRLNLSRQAAIDELTARGEPIEERIDLDVMADALSRPPEQREERRGSRDGRGGGRDRGGRDRGGRNGRGDRPREHAQHEHAHHEQPEQPEHHEHHD